MNILEIVAASLAMIVFLFLGVLTIVVFLWFLARLAMRKTDSISPKDFKTDSEEIELSIYISGMTEDDR